MSVYEVSPRDGLQNEGVTVPLSGKLRLVDALVAAGLKRIEITSFVSPKWIPQLADADDLCEVVQSSRAPAHPDVAFTALCPNAKGLERAKAAGMKEVAVFMSASPTHNKKNINKTIDETFAAFEETIGPARDAGMRVRGYVSTVWGCPYEGAVDPKQSIAIALRLKEMGCYQISLGDTIGAGTPRQTREIIARAFDALPVDAVAMHMHDTRGTALANVVVGLELGVRHFDAAVGGLGGCPYAPGAAGNVATEDLVYMLEGMGVKTGVDLERLVEAARAAEGIVGRQLPGKVHRAGLRSLRA
ncbi:MAG: hydroxymethylglutaryl-CoA lyase [Labilithrix sp.]|nr:hydroxymethylglutaryl-CoA lyase [Labilithrix sp.]MCW5812439.1 hydroxymethylglutaryl-CoA lyase [Labilithrix sp.]